MPEVCGADSDRCIPGKIFVFVRLDFVFRDRNPQPHVGKGNFEHFTKTFGL
jgi:hypothetical protein